MTEHYPADADLNALSGTIDDEQEVLFIATGESPYYTSFYKMLYRLLDVARRAGDLRVYKDGALSCGVRAGRFMAGDVAVDFPGATGQALSDNALNAVYLTVDAGAPALTVSTDGFPDPSTTPHLPLATIATADGAYAHADITDYRGRALLSACDGLTPDQANAAAAFFAATDLTGGEAETLSDGSVADALHVHDAAGLAAEAVTADKLAAAVAGDGLSGGAGSALSVNVDGSTIEIGAGALRVKDGGIAAPKLAAAATETITTDNQTIQHNDKPVVLLTLNGPGELTLGSTASAIADGSVDGQELTLALDTVTSGNLNVNDNPPTSNCRLQGNWLAYVGVGSWLHLRWNASDGNWWEVGRGNRENTNSGRYAGSAGGAGNTNSNIYCGSAGGQSNTNSSYYSGSVGGKSNTNSAYYCATVGGKENTNSAHFTGSVGGKGGKCRHQTETLVAANKRSTNGDAQVTNYLQRTGDSGYTVDANESTGPSWHELTTPERWVLEDGTAVKFRVSILGALSDQSKVASYDRVIVLKRDGSNNTTQIGATQTVGTDIEDDADWDVQLSADDTNESWKVEVHCADADSGTTAYWTAHVRAQVVG
ncbi:MAG: hypothetical protein ACOC8F_04215 [Planctomycetota bacterium]